MTNKATKLRIADVKRHIFLCVNDGGAQKCCTPEQASDSWQYLKARTAELGMLSEQGGSVFRSKAGCLRLCQNGPIAVVYPEGVWYENCSTEVLEKIITNHLLLGKIVEENVIKP